LLQLDICKAQKLGNQPEDYEDAIASEYATVEHFDNEWLLRLAVADGATESSFSKLWAELLVTEFVRNPFTDIDEMKRGVARSARVWNKIIRKKTLPWFAAEKVKMGAFSTVLGVLFLAPSSEGFARWKAIALGDSCLFQVRSQAIVFQFPVASPENFGVTPPLVSTNPRYNNQSCTHVVCTEGFWETNDVFFVMTDALSEWASREKTRRNVWNELLGVCTKNDSGELSFQDWADEHRKSGSMKNDDLTLAIVRVKSSIEASTT